MLLDFATSTHGVTYADFTCSGRATKKTSCTRRAAPLHLAERLIEDSYKAITINEATYRNASSRPHAAFDRRATGRSQEIADLTANRARLEAESDNSSPRTSPTPSACPP